MPKKRKVYLYLACLANINCGLQCLNQVEMALRRILLSVLLSLPSCLEISLFPTPRWENTYILKINVVLDLMINTHLGEILRVRISMSLSLAPTFSYHSRGETITSFRPLSVPTPWPVVEITSELGLAVGVSCYLLWEQSKTGWAWSEDMRGACCYPEEPARSDLAGSRTSPTCPAPSGLSRLEARVISTLPAASRPDPARLSDCSCSCS